MPFELPPPPSGLFPILAVFTAVAYVVAFALPACRTWLSRPRRPAPRHRARRAQR